METEPAAPRNQPAQGRDVSRQARRDEGARADRRRRGVQPTTASKRARRRSPAISTTREGEATDKHTVVFTFKELQRRVGLPLRLGLLLRHHAEGSRRRRRRQLEERQRHRPVPARRVRAGQLQHLRQEPELLGHREDRRHRDKLPFVDKVVYRIIKDEATFLTALRTGKLDISRPCAGSGRRAEEERAAAAMVEVARR